METPQQSGRTAIAIVNEGDPRQDSRAFRRCLGEYATGVTVITTRHAGGLAGVTANSFSSLSMDPPLIMWAISRTSRSFDSFRSAESFAVHVLSADQIAISRRFSGADQNKFAGLAWSPGQTGAPLIDGVAARFECRREAIYDGGDHVILVGRVEYYTHYETEGLLFARGAYGIAQDHPDLRTKTDIDVSLKNTPRPFPLLTLLSRAYHHMSARFEEHRNAEGVSETHSRVLAALYEKPESSLDDLVRATFLGRREAEDAVAELLQRGLVVRALDETLTLTDAGSERREAIGMRTAGFEAEQMKGIPEADVAAGRRFLLGYVSRHSV
ncbi:MAG: flavin reductase [Rhizobiales bacterium]|nr:flavin reductase [Hyphomicrobiales bacterium]